MTVLTPTISTSLPTLNSAPLLPPARPLPRPAPAFVSACHLPGNQTKLIREKHKAKSQICPQILLHTLPRLAGTAHRGADGPGEKWALVWFGGPEKLRSLLSPSAALAKRADSRKKQNPTWCAAVPLPMTLAPLAPRKADTGAEPDPDPAADKRAEKHSVRVLFRGVSARAHARTHLRPQRPAPPAPVRGTRLRLAPALASSTPPL
ncbi:uncharacterized protein LOC115301488 [Suricata suricatta]|uniref:uncharacterized protein LOC115301488 n=1 Tax=Suricata suricatta TaxID=37032 RepID=UPI001155FB8C|nr:uncharacterized protein LOC115301488 [Suricata suricatta]